MNGISTLTSGVPREDVKLDFGGKNSQYSECNLRQIEKQDIVLAISEETNHKKRQK
jgi:hypothetical protein